MLVEEMDGSSSISELGMGNIKMEPPDDPDDELIDPQVEVFEQPPTLTSVVFEDSLKSESNVPEPQEVGLVAVKTEPIEYSEENEDQDSGLKSEVESCSDNGWMATDALELATVKLETEDGSDAESQEQPTVGFSIGKWKRKLAGIMKDGPLAKVACGVGDGICPSKEDCNEKQIKIDLKESSVKTIFPCPECGDNFKEENLLQNHLKQHDSNLKYRCRVCCKCFFEDDLESYAGRVTSNMTCMTMKTPELENNYICFKCGSIFKDKYEIIGHIRTHLDQNSYICKLCFNRIVTRLT